MIRDQCKRLTDPIALGKCKMVFGRALSKIETGTLWFPVLEMK